MRLAVAALVAVGFVAVALASTAAPAAGHAIDYASMDAQEPTDASGAGYGLGLALAAVVLVGSLALGVWLGVGPGWEAQRL